MTSLNLEKQNLDQDVKNCKVETDNKATELAEARIENAQLKTEIIYLMKLEVSCNETCIEKSSDFKDEIEILMKENIFLSSKIDEKKDEVENLNKEISSLKRKLQVC